MRALLAGAAITLVCGSAIAAQTADDATTVVRGTRGARADSALKAAETEGFSGAVLVVDSGGVILRKGYGLAVRERKVPFTAGTVVQIGSNTKDFTAVAILQLQARGKLTVRDSLGKFFPAAPADKRGITLQQLLDHRSGFQPNLGPDFEEVDRARFLERAFASTLIYPPGQGERYSNLGFSMLAAVIEVVTGDSYGSYLQKNIWQPLGMRFTGLLFPRYDTLLLAHGYDGSADAGTMLERPHATDGPYWNLRGNGGFLSTVGEMYHFYDVLFNTTTLIPAEARDSRFPAGQPMILAGSDMVNFFLYDREPREGIVIIVATNASDYPAPRARDAIAVLLGLRPPQGPRLRAAGGGAHGAAPAAPVDFPETPVGRRAAEYIRLFNSGDSAAAVRFIQTEMITGPSDHRTPEQRAGQLRAMRSRLGAMVPVAIVSSSATQLVFTVRPEQEASATVTVEIEAAAPYRITGVGLLVE